jgi:hypothetical protein
MVFDLILTPFDESRRFYVESVLAIPLMSFFFLGYYSVMRSSLELMATEVKEEHKL